MKVEDFTSIHPRSFRHCSFELKKGEILGVAGLVGAQRTELMEGIFGLRAHTSGRVWIKGEEVNIRQPRDAIRKSVALLTEDRRATGIMGVLSVADNISIASLDALRKGPIMLDDKKILDLVATNKEKMAIKVPSPKTAIKSLSGGNYIGGSIIGAITIQTMTTTLYALGVSSEQLPVYKALVVILICLLQSEKFKGVLEKRTAEKAVKQR